MRWTAVGLLTFAIAWAPAAADTIILRNGSRISAAAVREEGWRVTYDTEDGSYSLSRSLVLRVERDEAIHKPAARAERQDPDETRARRASAISLPALPAAWDSEKPPLLPNGELDRAALESLARGPLAGGPDAHKLANVFAAALEHEVKLGRTESAMAVLRVGLSALPQDPGLALYYGVLLLNSQKYQEARDWLGRACLVAPNWPQVWKFLGFAEYYLDRTAEAIRSWRKSLSLAADAEVKEMLELAERETAAEAHHEQAFSSHFTLRFEGGQISPEFRRAILEELERHYERLERELGVSLREPIAVVLYTDRAFQDVTQAPSWAGAINDGRVRIGIDGLSSISTRFSSTLMHEMVHSFVWAKTHGRCPTWLDEGLAQLLQGKSAKGNLRLAQLWTEGKRLPLKSLEGPFNDLGAGLASVAYAESLAAVEFLAGQNGLFELVRLLTRLADGSQMDAALNSVYRLNYASLEEAITESVASRQ